MELKIPEIKLFGKKIAFPENELMEESSDGIGNDNSSGSDSNCCLNPSKVNCSEENEAGDDKDVIKQGVDKIINSKSVKERKYPIIEESQNPKDLSDFDTVSLDEESSGKQNPDSENDQSDTNNSQTKNLKKPDKIIPCPRCKSMETKFCYYNNYNVNQPRHFCKSCQRYWTAGGTMRNVPVGAGRRKNKNSVSNCTSNINISETAIHNGFHHKPNGTLLSFGSEIPVIEKIASNGNDFARNSCVNVSNRASHQGVKNGHQETVLQNINTFPAPVPVPVPYYPNHVNYPYPNPISIPVPGFCPPSFPMPFYPYCSIPGSWSFPWLPPVYPSAPLPPPSSENHCDFPNPKSLECKESNDLLKGSILVPKTLRIGDPNEAAMSSIWTTLGIIKNDSTTNCDLFKAFQPKNNAEKKLEPATSSLLQANPAALSRSVNFQETA